MDDERVDRLLASLAAKPSPAAESAERVLATVLPVARRARAADGRWYAPAVRLVERSFRGPALSRSPRMSVGWIGIALLLLLAAIFVSAVGRQVPRLVPQSGPILIARLGSIETIDPASGSRRSLVETLGAIRGLAPSPDGRFVSFWTIGTAADELAVIGTDGSDRRTLAGGIPMRRVNCRASWSTDGRWVVTAARVGRAERLLLIDVPSGEVRYLPVDRASGCPSLHPGGTAVAITRRDRTETALTIFDLGNDSTRDVIAVSPETAIEPAWARDGSYLGWVEDGGIWVADAAGEKVRQVAGSDFGATAVIPSHGASLLVAVTDDEGRASAWLLDRESGRTRLIERDATPVGWSADDTAILLASRPLNAAGGLVVVRADGSQRRLLAPFDVTCEPSGARGVCPDDIAWGQPVP